MHPDTKPNNQALSKLTNILFAFIPKKAAAFEARNIV